MSTHREAPRGQECQMTMGEYGHYYACGKLAKSTYVEKAGSTVRRVCGHHARGIEKRRPGSTTPISK